MPNNTLFIAAARQPREMCEKLREFAPLAKFNKTHIRTQNILSAFSRDEK